MPVGLIRPKSSAVLLGWAIGLSPSWPPLDGLLIYGLVIDLDRLCFYWLVVCSGPYAEINMKLGEIDGYDAIFLSPHKFLGGPGSPGVLLMSKALYQLDPSAPPSTCGGGTVNYVNGFNEKV